jgi:hypothetical protein
MDALALAEDGQFATGRRGELQLVKVRIADGPVVAKGLPDKFINKNSVAGGVPVGPPPA